MCDQRPVSRFGLVCGVTILVTLLGCTSDASEEDSPSLAGTWVQVYPASGALEELTLRSDGIVEGSVAGLDTLIRPLTHWKIGHGPSTDGFCVGNSQRWLCQGYVLAGDTLWLANRTRTTYLRAGRTAAPVRPWESPRREAQSAQPPRS